MSLIVPVRMFTDFRLNNLLAYAVICKALYTAIYVFTSSMVALGKGHVRPQDETRTSQDLARTQMGIIVCMNKE